MHRNAAKHTKFSESESQLDMISRCSATSIPPIMTFFAEELKHVWLDFCKCACNSFASTDRKCALSVTNPCRRKSSGVKSGDRGGHDMGPARPTHRFGSVCWDARTLVRGNEEGRRLAGKIQAHLQKSRQTRFFAPLKKIHYRWDIYRATSGRHIEL
jgi:hypothetical protein